MAKAPPQKPHRSEQVVGTPRTFLDAVERRFGTIAWDLAAIEENAVCEEYLSPEQDSLSVSWGSNHLKPGVRWLNPPFANIAPWAAKCASEATFERPILLLTPASVGANWYWDHVAPNAMVFALSPRLTFVGSTSPYPKDLILSVFGMGCPGFTRWRWS